jgi:hypothetical protein
MCLDREDFQIGVKMVPGTNFVKNGAWHQFPRGAGPAKKWCLAQIKMGAENGAWHQLRAAWVALGPRG